LNIASPRFDFKWQLSFPASVQKRFATGLISLVIYEIKVALSRFSSRK
jgi:hypothetical protein